MGRPSDRTRSTIFTLALALAVPACGAPGEDALSGVFPEGGGAGVEVVENDGPDGGFPPEWTIDPAPLLKVGGGPEAGGALFEVAGAVRLWDGRVVVANGGAGRLDLFGPDGSFLRSVGGEGAGPGEFRSMGAVWRYRGDSIAVFDGSTSRVSVFDRDGGYGRSIRLDGGGALLEPIGVFDDGSVVFAAESFSAGAGVWRDSATCFRVLADGSRTDTLGRWPTEERYAATRGGRPVLGILPFGRRTWAATGPRTLHVATGEAFRIAGFSPDGRPTRLVTAPIQGERLTDAQIQRYERDRLVRIRGSRAYASVRAVFESGQVPYPDRLPPHGRILVDGSGGLWVQRVPAPGDRAVRWDVLDAGGRWAGRVAAPEGVELLQVARDRVLGLHRDSLGIETVRLHRIQRDDGPARSDPTEGGRK